MKLQRADSGRWTLSGFSLEDLSLIEGIPGLLAVPFETAVKGSVDACVAAVQRIGNVATQKPLDWHELSGIEAALTPLRQYQRQGVEFMETVLRAYSGVLLADDMGLGKTLQAITVCGRIATPRDRILVAAPAAARETWREQLAKWAPDEPVAVVGPGTTKADLAEWKASETARWVVSSYDLIMSGKIEETAYKSDVPGILVMDEAHRLKGRKAKRSKALLSLSQFTRYRIAMTGTPVWDRPKDLWMLLHILFGYRFGGQYEFDREYCDGRVNEHGGWVNKGALRTDELRHRLSFYMLRREKREVAHELPPLTRVVRWVEATPKARAAFQKLELKLDGGHVHSALEATLDGKMEEAMEVATESGRFLLFTWLKRHAFEFHKRLNEEGVPCQLITGEVDTKERQKRIDIARTHKHSIVATIDSASESVNMQGIASTGIMHSIDWVPTKMAQAEARLHRIGATDPVTWIYLAMKDSADQLVVRSVVNKLDAFIATMGATDIQGMRNELNAYENGSGLDELAILREMAASLSEGTSDDE